MKRVYPLKFMMIVGSVLAIAIFWVNYCLLTEILTAPEEIGIFLIAFYFLFFVPMSCWFLYYLGPHLFGVLTFKEEYLMYCGLFLPVVKLEKSKIKYVEIRTFDKDNVFYGESARNCIDAYKFVLISYYPIPNKRVDKIRPSRKKKLIKLAVSEKLCECLMEELPPEKTKQISYQLYLYKRFGGK